MLLSSALRRLLCCLSLYAMCCCLARAGGVKVAAAPVVPSSEESAASSSSSSAALPLSERDPSPLPNPFMPAKVFHVGLVAKLPSHPLYGVGDPYCYSIDGVAGGNVSVVAGGSYAFQAMNLALDYAMYVSTSDIGAGAGQLSPYAAGDSSLLWTVALPIERLLQAVNRSTVTARRLNSSAAINSTSSSGNGSIPFQFLSPFGPMLVTGRFAFGQSATNQRSSADMAQAQSNMAAAGLSVDALPLSSTRAAESEAGQTGPANSTAINTMDGQQPIAELYLQSLLHFSVGVPIYILPGAMGHAA